MNDADKIIETKQQHLLLQRGKLVSDWRRTLGTLTAIDAQIRVLQEISAASKRAAASPTAAAVQGGE
jgi:hypothetical protein